MADAEPTAYLPDLAASLLTTAQIRNDHGIEVGAALKAVDEAIAIYQKLAEHLPDAFNGYL